VGGRNSFVERSSQAKVMVPHSSWAITYNSADYGKRHTHTHTHIQIYMYIYICIYVYMYMYMYICIYIYTHIHSAVYIYTEQKSADNGKRVSSSALSRKDK
jgi:hypothetical protein